MIRYQPDPPSRLPSRVSVRNGAPERSQARWRRLRRPKGGTFEVAKRGQVRDWSKTGGRKAGRRFQSNFRRLKERFIAFVRTRGERDLLWGRKKRILLSFLLQNFEFFKRPFRDKNLLDWGKGGGGFAQNSPPSFG